MASDHDRPPDQPTPTQRPEGLIRGPAVTGQAARPLRGVLPLWQRLLFGLVCLAVVLGLWWFLTRGERSEDRIVSQTKLPSPSETFRTFPSLFIERDLVLNSAASVARTGIGFALAAVVGVPLGILCGCFPRLASLFAPLLVFGRNIPMAALIPLSMMLFGLGEFQKVMFIFVAAVAFIISDSAQAITNVAQRYVDTAYTLGASRGQTIRKVLVPLAMPHICNSLRLLFGLAFGYIMLAEVIQTGGASGLGGIINMSQRRGPKEHILLVLFLIPVIALAIDRILFVIQMELFPWMYDSAGLLASAWKQGTAAVGGLFTGGKAAESWEQEARQLAARSKTTSSP